MNILFCAKAPDATKHYRVDIPAKYLGREDGVNVAVKYAEQFPQIPKEHVVTSDDLAIADVVIFQRPVTVGVAKQIVELKEKHIHTPVICDYDDDYYSVPRWNPGYPHLKTNEKVWKQFVKEIDGAICSTAPLRDRLRKNVHKKASVVTIGNGFDYEEFDKITPYYGSGVLAPDPVHTDKIVPLYDIEMQQFNDMAKDRTVFMWAGSKFHYCDLDWIPESIGKVMHDRDDIIFLFVGYMQGNLVKVSKANSLFLAKGIPGVLNFYSLLAGIKADVIMAPLDPNAFNRSKSNLKLMESMALGSYPLCSAWDPYEEDLDPDMNPDNTVHGRLVGYEKGDWYRSIMSTADKLSDLQYVRRMRLENDAYMRTTHAAELRTPVYLNYFRKMIEKKRGLA